MSLFNPSKKGKPKATRAAAIRKSPSFFGRISAAVYDRHVALRILMCVATVVALDVATEGWKSPFTYRVGDYTRRGIPASTSFQRINNFETKEARARAESQVPFIFTRDSSVLYALPTRFRSKLTDVAEAKTLNDVPVETRASFGWILSVADEQNENLTNELNQEFSTVRASIAPEDESTGSRIDKLVAEFDQLIAPLYEPGLASADELTRNNIRGNDLIAIHEEGDSSFSEPVPISEVVLTDILKQTGRLGKDWGNFPELTLFRPVVERWLISQSPVTLTFNARLTQISKNEARNNVQPITDNYALGQILIPANSELDEESISLLRAEYDQIEQSTPWPYRVMRIVVAFVLILVLVVLNAFYLVQRHPRLVGRARLLGVYLLSVVAAVATARLFSLDPWRAEIIPILTTVMVFTIAYNQTVSLLTAFSMSLLITLSTTQQLPDFVALMSVTTTAVMLLPRVHSRSTIIKIGFAVAAAYLLIFIGLGLVNSHPVTNASLATEVTSPDGVLQTTTWDSYARYRTLFFDGLRGVGWCLVTGFFVAGSLPFVESTFGVVTDISLLEMSDVSHPLLQQLVQRAPGTHNHSMTVASIAETAADRIGANGLLVRVGAYFHDIGKTLKPDYFIENMTDGSESRHDLLAPAMSTLIIIGHVKDGVDLARQHNLPEPLIDFIEQHHGTTLVEYFYHEATKQADKQPDHKTDAEESSFRYPGPKPQSREAGVMMLADAVESASRTLSEPTPQRIKTLVHEITMKRLLDGQFDESLLTLNEIHEIEESLIKSLTAIYHGRIKYPEQQSA